MLRAMFNRAIAWELWKGDNPAEGVTKFRERSRDRFLQPSELPRFFEAVAQAPRDTRDFLLLALLTGARRSNVLAMRWEDVRIEEATWRIPQTKTGEALTVPLVAEAVAVLETRRVFAGDSPWIFPSRGKTGHMVEPKRAWVAVKKRAGVEDLHLHDLRRSLGSWQAATGASLVTIGKSLGHSNVSTTAIYARLNLDPVRASLEKATRAMLAAAGVLPIADVQDIKTGT